MVATMTTMTVKMKKKKTLVVGLLVHGAMVAAIVMLVMEMDFGLAMQKNVPIVMEMVFATIVMAVDDCTMINVCKVARLPLMVSRTHT